MLDEKVGFIGAGNMGLSMLCGLASSGKICPSSLWVYDIVPPAELPDGVQVANSIEALVETCSFVVFAVKPNVFGSVLETVAHVHGYRDKNYISIAAGITTDFIKQILGDVKITRVMPNLPLKVGEGMTVVSTYPDISDADKRVVETIFSASGKACFLGEDFIDKALAINGSGPAYVFLFIEAMADAAVQNGVDRKTAYTLAAQTVLGSAKMVLETGLHPGVLKDMVCSPAGTTIDAVAELEQAGFRSAVIRAVQACTNRARQMSEGKQ